MKLISNQSDKPYARRVVTAAVLAFILATASASPTAAQEGGDGDAGVDTSSEVLDVLSSIPEVDAIVESDRADPSTVTVDEGAGTVNVEAVGPAATGATAGAIAAANADSVNVGVELSAGSVDAVLGDGTALSMTLPNNDDSSSVSGDGTIVVEDPLPDTDLVVQPQQDAGVRVVTVIDGDDAPTRFDFPIDADGTVKVAADGSAAVVDENDFIIAAVDKPWGFDRDGTAVDTRYSTDGDTLTLHVDHTGAGVAYPVVADPRLDWGNISGTAYFNVEETEGIAFVGAQTLPSLITVPPPFSAILASYAVNIIGWAGSAMALGKCLKLKFGFTFKFTGAPSPGISPGHHTGTDCY